MQNTRTPYTPRVGEKSTSSFANHMLRSSVHIKALHFSASNLEFGNETENCIQFPIKCF